MKAWIQARLGLSPYRVEEDELALRILEATAWLRSVRRSGEPLTGDLFPLWRRRR